MRYLLILLLSVNFVFAQSKEVRKFGIQHKGKALGIITATKEKLSNGNIVYTTKANINKTVLNIKKLDYNLVVEMQNDVLFKSDYTLHVNGKLKHSSTLKTENGKLVRTAEGKKLDPMTDEIKFVSSMFLFQSPNGYEKTFSESKQKYRTIYANQSDSKKFGLGKSSKKIDTEYTYEENDLVNVYIDDFVDFTMVPMK